MISEVTTRDIDRSRAFSSLSAALPAYEIGDELGRGAHGVVLAARHRQLDRTVAIKQLPSADAAAQSRFIAEARILAGLDHPHIVDVYDFVDRDGMCLLVMEHLTGGTLWSRFETGAVTAEVSCALLLAVCAGLHHAHQRGVLHRDVKPENLMFTGDGTLKITDAGIAKVVGSAPTLTSGMGVAIGTPAYISPEQARGDEVAPATDVYQAGTVLFELLAGRLPFPVDCDLATLLYRHVHTSPPPLLEVAPDIPASLAAVVDRSIATSPADRYESAEAFGVAIATAAMSAWGRGWLARTNVPVSASAILSAAVGSTKQPANSIRPTAPGVEARQQHSDEKRVEATTRTAKRTNARTRARRSYRGIVVPVVTVVVVLVAAVAVAMARDTSEPRDTSLVPQTGNAPHRAALPATPTLIAFPETPSRPQGGASTAQAITSCAPGLGGCPDHGTPTPETIATASVDRIPPTITWSGGPADGGSYIYGHVPASPACTTSDAGSGPKKPDDCNVSGYRATVGSHTLTATAHDNAGNMATETRSYTVSAWTLTGFYQPVEMSASNIAWNAVNNGSTVPLSFNVHAGDTELTDTASVVSFTPTSVPCPPAMTTSSVNATTTGPTSLHYDTTAHRFTQDWQTPAVPGGCYKATITTQDGSTLAAYFTLV